MAEHARWDDNPQPVNVVAPPTYDTLPAGPVREAALLDTLNGKLAGWVWTDGEHAAGFRQNDAAGADAVHAAGYVWGMLKHCFDAGVPAAEVLDPELYEPKYRLSGTTPSRP